MPSVARPQAIAPAREFGALLRALGRPAAYGHPAGDIQIIQTHISTVFLAGPYAYKVKKPVNLGFLDFTTPERRRKFCEEEVRLNRRLAPDVYVAVAPIVQRNGALRVGGEGEPIDWAIQMKRLPQERTLDSLLARGELDTATLARLAKLLAEFHARADRNEEIARWGSWGVVADNCRENFRQIEPFIGQTLSKPVFERLVASTEAELKRLQPLIAERSRRGVACDTHGDLHLDHVYFFPDEPPPRDLVIVDCIEFNERFRYSDPAADLAFLLMDLRFHGRADLASALRNAYLQESGDAEMAALLPFYSAYRAIVRGKVESFELREAEIPEAEKGRATGRARAHFLLALGELAPPPERPCMILVGGLPGSGKTQLSASIAEAAGLERISTDLVRKELAGLAPGDSAAAPLGQGIYSAEWDDLAYAAALERARTALLEGRRAVIDAGFREDRRRRAFIETARELCVPCLLLICEAGEAASRARLLRTRQGGSDADWEIHQGLAARWEQPSAEWAAITKAINTEGAPEATLAAARAALAAEGLG